MRVMVTGASGQLGFDCVQWLEEHGVACCGVDREHFDLTDADAVRACVEAWKPDAILHCGAYTQVNRAETQPEVCMAVNGMGTLNLVRAALAVNAKLMYVSSDYAFAGNADEPYTVQAQTCPQNVYGLSKVQGEEAVRSLMQRYFIVRTGWLYSRRGSNIVKSTLRAAAGQAEITVEEDLIGSPTFTEDLAALLCTMLATERYGVYHACSEGYCSSPEFAQEVLRLCGSRCRVRSVPMRKRAYSLTKPHNARLDMTSLDQAGFKRLPEWQDALERFLEQNGMLQSARGR